VFSPGSFSNPSIQGVNPTVTFNLIVQNTSDSDLLLNSLAANVMSNGTLIGNVSNFSGGVTIAANSSTIVPVVATLQPLGIVSDLLQSIENGTVTQSIEMKGNANVNAIQVPLDVTFSATV
jgi:hypothetical protein